MSTSARIFETAAFELRNLDEEHAEIRCRYVGLKKVIQRGEGMLRILTAADNLVRLILLHLNHEEQLLVKLSRSCLQRRQREAKMKIATQLFGIEAELEQGNVAAVFRLLRLGRVWMKEHMHLESEEIECEGLTEKEKPFFVRRAAR